MVSTRRAAAAARARAAAMAFSKLSGDEQGVILGQLRNTLEPRLSHALQQRQHRAAGAATGGGAAAAEG